MQAAQITPLATPASQATSYFKCQTTTRPVWSAQTTARLVDWVTRGKRSAKLALPNTTHSIMAPNVSWTRLVRQAGGSIARHSPASSAPATASHAKRAWRMGLLCACRAQLTWSWTRLFASRSVTAKKSSLTGKLQIAPSALSASIQTGPTKDAGHALTRTVSTAYSSRVLFNLSGKRNALHAKMIFGSILNRECAGLNVIQHLSLISIHKAAVLVQQVIIKIRRIILADPVHQAANLVSCLRTQPNLYAWLVSLPAKKLMRSINQFAAEIANQINTSMPKDGNAKSVLQANM